MANYHFVYKDVEGASTQWDEIQRKLGNLPEKPPPFTPAADEDSKPRDKSWIHSKTEDQLDDDRFLHEYRKKRLEEMREAAKLQKYGSVVPISGSDFVREVHQMSGSSLSCTRMDTRNVDFSCNVWKSSPKDIPQQDLLR